MQPPTASPRSRSPCPSPALSALLSARWQALRTRVGRRGGEAGDKGAGASGEGHAGRRRREAEKEEEKARDTARWLARRRVDAQAAHKHTHR